MKKTVILLIALIVMLLAMSMVVSADYQGLAQDENGVFWYYNGDAPDTTKSGMVEFGDGLFVVIDGLLRTDFQGMCHVEFPDLDKWYFFSAGQVQKETTGFAEYNGAWFYLDKGELDDTKTGIYEYDGGQFLLAEGRLIREYSGLYQNTEGEGADDKWYFFALGQLQEGYTGLAEYDGAWFYLKDGCLQEDYTGKVEYGGENFDVVNGMLVGNEDMPSEDAGEGEKPSEDNNDTEKPSEDNANDGGEADSDATLPVYYVTHDKTQTGLLFITDGEPEYDIAYMEIHYVSKEDAGVTTSEVVKVIYGSAVYGICGSSEIWASGKYDIVEAYLCDADKKRICEVISREIYSTSQYCSFKGTKQLSFYIFNEELDNHDVIWTVLGSGNSNYEGTPGSGKIDENGLFTPVLTDAKDAAAEYYVTVQGEDKKTGAKATYTIIVSSFVN